MRRTSIILLAALVLASMTASVALASSVLLKGGRMPSPPSPTEG